MTICYPAVVFLLTIVGSFFHDQVAAFNVQHHGPFVSAKQSRWGEIRTRSNQGSNHHLWQLYAKLGAEEVQGDSSSPLVQLPLNDRTTTSLSVADVAPVAVLVATTVAACTMFPLWAQGATGTSATPGPIPSAFVAYAHYLSILLATALLTYERVTVAPNMSVEAEKSCVIADACYGLVAVGIFASGYFRVVEYGKGWEFYAHEPFFWLKLCLGGVVAGLSLFPTTIFVQRGRALFAKDDTTPPPTMEPLSEPLAARLIQIINAELTAVASIPLVATLMARGVGYSNDFPWPVGAGFAVLSLVGSSALYLKQALQWSETDAVLIESEGKDEP